MRFQTGDIVKISKQSEYYDTDVNYNPKDMAGKVIMIGNNGVRVIWLHSNRSNGYKESDLRLVRRES